MTNIRSVDLNLLVAFDAIFDELNVTRAADRLAVSQPTASGMLRRLREIFDDDLFLRTSHGLLPTPRAEALSGPVKALLHEAEAIISPGSFEPSTAAATFRLSASDYMQQAVVLPAIRRLRRLSPASRVAAVPRSPARLAEQMARGEVDVCICAEETVLPEMKACWLYPERYVCVGRAAHRFGQRRLSLDQIVSCDHLLVDPSGNSFVGPVDHAIARSGRSRRVAATVPTFSDLFCLLQSEDYLAFVPERLAKQGRAGVRVFETDIELLAFDVVAMWHPRFEREPRHIWLRTLLVDVVGIAASEDLFGQAPSPG